MRITYLLLKSFKRFPLMDSEIFEHNFNSKLTLIIGPNGCGKSSLFNELTPLPSDKNNFNKNGYKEIHIEKNKQHFKLISDFTDGAKYYFYLNDENLNLSNNISTQRELVYKYFNINTIIHDILIGNESFTEMSLLNRKKLFNSITHLNIDKVIECYNTLKENLKNNEFLLKTQLSLRQAEEQKLINKDHLENLLNNQKQIKDYIDTLLAIRNELYKYKNQFDLDASYSKYKELLNKFNSIIEKYYTYLTSYSDDRINVYKSKLEIINFKLNALYTSLEKKQEEINILNLNKEHDIKTLQNNLENLKEINNRLIGSLTIFKDIDFDYTEAKNDLYKLEVSLLDILRTIPLNENKKYSKEKYEELLNLKNNYLNELNNIILTEVELNREIEHLKSHKKDIVCPSCSFQWSLYENDEKIKKINLKIKNILERKLFLQKNLETLNKSLEEMTEYFNIYKQYSTLRNMTYNSLKPFWNIVDSHQYIFNSPESIISLMKTLNEDLVILDKIKENQQKCKELSRNIEILNNLQNTNLINLNKEIDEIQEAIYNLQLEKNEINQHILNNQISINARNALLNIKKTLEESLDNLFSSNLCFTIEQILNLIDSELSKHKITLIEIEKEINNYNNIKYTLSKYDKQIEDIQSNIKILNLILNELSPKNGLIARSVSSFLNIIINNINSIINSVWDYKMLLKAINIEDEILNYKFKVEVENKIIIDDISKCSAGMRKIINFAFIKVMYKLLKLDNYPLFLDEFTTNLDSVHTQRFAQLINQLSMTDAHSQIFIISHINNDFYFSNKDIDIINLGA